MLSEISIKNFAIIESLDVTFDEGLTVLTGETGAGKSIIIDAVQLLAGGRGSQEFIRHGAKKAELEGLFTIEDPKHPAIAKLKEFGIEVGRRSGYFTKRFEFEWKKCLPGQRETCNHCSIEGNQFSIIDIHGQHENQELMQERRHIHFSINLPVQNWHMHMQSYSGLYD